MKIDGRQESVLMIHFLRMSLFKIFTVYCKKKFSRQFFKGFFLWFNVLFCPSSYDDVSSIVQDFLFIFNFTFSQPFLSHIYCFWVDNVLSIVSVCVLSINFYCRSWQKHAKKESFSWQIIKRSKIKGREKGKKSIKR